jgi:hypothetical protein
VVNILLISAVQLLMDDQTFTDSANFESFFCRSRHGRGWPYGKVGHPGQLALILGAADDANEPPNKKRETKRDEGIE